MKHKIRLTVFCLSVSGLLSACLPSQPPAEEFFENMMVLCDRTVEGRIISNQAVDADWIRATLIVGPVDCAENVIRMPLAVGADASRTWVVSRVEGRLEFRHEHIEPDGSPSPVTQYGGFNDASAGTARQQDFPADEKTKANFTENGIPQSNTNIWTFTIDPEAGTLIYALARPATETDPARDFRAVFDLQ